MKTIYSFITLHSYADRAKITITFLILCILSSLSAASAQTEFASSLNPVGSGARATGMGGAFIAVADDATAAAWNPAGLAQLEKPEISGVYSFFHRQQTYLSEDSPEISGGQNMDAYGLNYASLAYPFIFMKRNMIVSLNYQRLFEMNKDYSFDFITSSTSPLITISESGGEDFVQEGYLYTLSPAVAMDVTPDFYIGVTYNFWDNLLGKNGWEIKSTQVQKKTRRDAGNTFELYTETRQTHKDDISFKGQNVHLGFLWRVVESISIGGVYKTAFDADLSRKRTTTNYVKITQEIFPALPTETVTTATTSVIEDFVLRMPASYGIGLSYRQSDSLTFALDVYRTEWSRFVQRASDGSETNPLTGSPISEGRLKDTTQVRLGMEYLSIKDKYVVPLRLGLFYDPEPATNHLDDYYGFSLGTGFARGRVVLDTSYQYRMGKNVTTDFPAVDDSDPDIDQHTVMVSAILYL